MSHLVRASPKFVRLYNSLPEKNVYGFWKKFSQNLFGIDRGDNPSEVVNVLMEVFKEAGDEKVFVFDLEKDGEYTLTSQSNFEKMSRWLINNQEG